MYLRIIIVSLLMTSKSLSSLYQYQTTSTIYFKNTDTIDQRLDTNRFKIKGKIYTGKQRDSIINVAIKETMKSGIKKGIIK